ncbi:hypothetical protein Ancab_029876 [Ancistrocladus abbreviatus]
MATERWTQEDTPPDSAPVPQTEKELQYLHLQNKAVRSAAEDNVPFLFMPLSVAPFSAGSMHETSSSYASNLPAYNFHGSITGHEHTTYIPAFDHNINGKNDIPSLGIQVSSSSGSIVSASRNYGSNGCDGNADRGMNSGEHFNDNLGTEMDDNLNGLTNAVGRFPIVSLDGEANDCSQQPDMNRNPISFRGSLKEDIFQTGNANCLTVSTLQPGIVENLDGSFLSLGYRGSPDSRAGCYAFGGGFGGLTERSFSTHGLPAYQGSIEPIDNMAGGCHSLQNQVCGFVSPTNNGDHSTLSKDNHGAVGGTTSGLDTSSFPIFPRQHFEVQQFMPMPNSRTFGIGNEMSSSLTLGLGQETNSRFTSMGSEAYSAASPGLFGNNDVRRPELSQVWRSRLPSEPVISRSSHLSSTKQLHNSSTESNTILPLDSSIVSPFAGTFGNTGRHDPSELQWLANGGTSVSANEGVDLPNQISFEGVDQVCQEKVGFIQTSQNFVRPASPKGQMGPPLNESKLACTSNAVGRQLLKRGLVQPPLAMTRVQRQKTMSQHSAQQSIPSAGEAASIANALGKTMPPFSAFVNAYPSFSNTLQKTIPQPSIHPSHHFPVQTAMPQNGLVKAFPPSHLFENTSPSLTNTLQQSIPQPSMHQAVAPPVQTACPQKAFEKPLSPFTTLTNNGSVCNGAKGDLAFPASVKIPPAPNFSERTPAGSIASRQTPAALMASVKASYPACTSSPMTLPAVGKLTKSSRAWAALAKRSPALVALAKSASTPHIKWQGSDVPQPIGIKCLLCKRDLSYTSEGPVSQPSIPPVVAVLPCGHTFHDQCLLRITAENQSKDPPCIPCAVVET